MKTGKSLVELASELERRKAGKVDFIAPAQSLVTVVDSKDQGVSLVVPNQGEFPIAPIAHEQIASHTGIPKKYYDRMLTEDPSLLTNNINRWLSADESKRMVRTMYGKNRAFLSNKYQRIENEEIAARALEVLLSTPGLDVISTEVTERRLYIQATTTRITGEVKKGDPVQAGVIITNSETGHGSVSVQRVIYRLVCLNGLVLPDGKYRANHTGARLDDNEALWKDDTRQADDKAVLLKVRDMVSAAVSDKHFGEYLTKLRATTEQKISGDPIKAVEVLSQKLGVNEAEKGGILRSLIEGHDLSRWGFVNAVTAQAHVANDYDRSVEFERLGANVIDLSPKDWQEVAEAA
jgi:hypothetical protein